jgi:hypothetical protein
LVRIRIYPGDRRFLWNRRQQHRSPPMKQCL